uniref:Uncharacterized protein n=1 Tax=Arundo donax TaxID=35708 RepID=A0A0A9FMF6_ARUDO
MSMRRTKYKFTQMCHTQESIKAFKEIIPWTTFMEALEEGSPQDQDW